MNWLKQNWRYFAIFGGIVSPILVVMIYALATGGDPVHIGFREFVIHVPWGICLTMLAVVLMMTAQNQRGMPFAWRTKYILPFAAVMACAAIQEFAFSMTELFAGNWKTVLGGDWNRPLCSAQAEVKGCIDDLWQRYKSIADLCGWAFGALAAMWYHYKASPFLYAARVSALSWKSDRRKA